LATLARDKTAFSGGKTMNRFYVKCAQVLPVVMALCALAPSASFAGFFGDHPRYLHALSDMRYARSLVLRPDDHNVVVDERNAAHELDIAITEIKEAAAEDWKPVNAHPPVDTNLDRPGRLHEAIKVLDKAQHDLSQEEDDSHAGGLRNQAINHLKVARNFVRQAIGDKEFDRGL
jgi:hypothetical protein